MQLMLPLGAALLPGPGIPEERALGLGLPSIFAPSFALAFFALVRPLVVLVLALAAGHSTTLGIAAAAQVPARSHRGGCGCWGRGLRNQGSDQSPAPEWPPPDGRPPSCPCLDPGVTPRSLSTLPRAIR